MPGDAPQPGERTNSRRRLAVALVALGLLVSLPAGCGEDSSDQHTPGVPHGPAAHVPAGGQAPASHRHEAHPGHHRQPSKPHQSTQPASAVCPPAAKTLKGVYHPDRLAVLDPCRRASGRVTSATVEEDGDLHFDVALDEPARSMLMSGNRTEQDGDLVVELMPRDYGHIDAPEPGDRVEIVGAYVNDTIHSWAELHPVWGLTISGRSAGTSGPQFGGSPPSALSDDALATCRTDTGRRCRGYNGSVAPPPDGESDAEKETRAATAAGAGKRGGGKCNPNYSGCVPPYPPDVDCDQVKGPVKVLGTDPDNLDGDGDGIGCES